MGGLHRAGFISLLLLIPLSTTSATGQSFTLVARSGAEISGSPGATFGESFFGAAVNDAGHVAFSGGVREGETSAAALFAGTPGDMRTLIRAGDDAAGIGAGVKYGSVYSAPQID